MSDIDKRIEEIVREKGPITFVNIGKELDLDIAIASIFESLSGRRANIKIRSKK